MNQPTAEIFDHLFSPLTSQEAANRLRVTKETILVMLQDGRLKGTKASGRWLISRDSVDLLLPPPIKPAKTIPNHGPAIASGCNFGDFEDPLYEPDYSIPPSVQTRIDSAMNGGSWFDVGTALGKYMLSQWPKYRGLDNTESGIDTLVSQMYSAHPVKNESDFNYEILQVVWLHIRFPNVIESAPTEKIFELVRGAVQKIFG